MTMKPRDRFLRAVKGEPVDRVPIKLDCFDCPSTDKLWHESFAPIAERVLPEMHFYHRWPSHVNRYYVTNLERIRTTDRRENGDIVTLEEIDTPKGKLTGITRVCPQVMTRWTVKYPVSCLEDIEKIRSIPWEPPAKLSPPDRSDLPEGFEQRGVLQTGISSPFVCAAGLMAYNDYLELCALEYDLVEEMTVECAERVDRILDVLLGTRALDCVWIGGCEWLTPPMGSPELYEKLVQRFEAPIIRRVHEAGAVAHVHCHGRVGSTLEKIVERGADFTEPVEPPPDGDITFAEAKALARGRITLGGNVEARILEREDEAAVEQATRAAFEGGKRRMVLQQSAGPIRPLTDRQVRNYHRMIDVWEALSPC